MQLIDIQKFHLKKKTAEYTFFSSVHETFFRIDHILGTKQVSVNLRGLKSYQASFLTTMV